MNPYKIILDVDPGLEEALVLSLALFDPEVDVVALTSTGGRVDSQTASRNLRGIVEFLDPPHRPRIGFGDDPEGSLPLEEPSVCGRDGLAGFVLPRTERRTPVPAEKVICDVVRSQPGEVSILCFGPLTNMARALLRDPELQFLIKRLYICGGTCCCPGNVAPTAEFNIYANAKAAQLVFRSACSKTLIPLDVVEQMSTSIEILQELPSNETNYGNFLQHLFVSLFRGYRNIYGIESIPFHELATWFAVLHPALFEKRYEFCDVETIGLLTLGEIVYDRRINRVGRKNVEVFYRVNDPDQIRKKMIEGFRRINKILS